MSQEPEDLTEFKNRLWRAVTAARRRHRWCGAEFTILREQLGITGPQATDRGVPEPSEDGVYRISTATYFFIRYTDGRDVYWVITALHQPRHNTPEEKGTWADVVEFLYRNGLMPDQHRQLVKM